MDWIQNLLFNDASVAHTVILYAFVIALGVALGKMKFFGISLGVTFVLFVGLIAGHFGFSAEKNILHFVQEFGLILFIYSIGLQVGPSFFSSFKKGGLTLNMLAVGIVILNRGLPEQPVGNAARTMSAVYPEQPVRLAEARLRQRNYLVLPAVDVGYLGSPAGA